MIKRKITNLYDVEFVPFDNYNGAASFTFKAWDRSVVDDDVSVFNPDSTGHFSQTIATATIVVDPENDSPTISCMFDDNPDDKYSDIDGNVSFTVKCEIGDVEILD